MLISGQNWAEEVRECRRIATKTQKTQKGNRKTHLPKSKVRSRIHTSWVLPSVTIPRVLFRVVLILGETALSWNRQRKKTEPKENWELIKFAALHSNRIFFDFIIYRKIGFRHLSQLRATTSRLLAFNHRLKYPTEATLFLKTATLDLERFNAMNEDILFGRKLPCDEQSDSE